MWAAWPGFRRGQRLTLRRARSCDAPSGWRETGVPRSRCRLERHGLAVIRHLTRPARVRGERSVDPRIGFLPFHLERVCKLRAKHPPQALVQVALGGGEVVGGL